MNLSLIDESLLVATFYRGNAIDHNFWTSCSDQVLTLSLFFTGDITFVECQHRFSNRSYVGGLYDDDGELESDIAARYQDLINLLHAHPTLIEGGGDFEMPAYPTYTACRLTNIGLRLIPEIIDLFPRTPDFPNWPDQQAYPGTLQ